MASRRLNLLLAALVLSLACSPTDSRRGHRHPALSDTPQTGGTLRVPLATDPASMNPLLGRRAPVDLWHCFYPSLVTLQSRGAETPEVRGDLARRWQWSDDAHALTMVLNSDRYWQDTVRVRGADVLRSYAAYQAMGQIPVKGVADSLDPGLTAVEAVDDSTLRFHFRPGFPSWKIWPVLSWPILPAHKLADLRPDFLESSPLAREPLSAGPFRLLEWRPGLNLWIGPNAVSPRRPWLRRVSFEPCPGVDARILRLAMGGADVVTDVPVYRLAPLLDGFEGVEAHRAGIASVEMLFWNLRDPFSSPAVREALAYGINRDRLADALLSWRGERYGGAAFGLLEPAGPPGIESASPDSASPTRAHADTTRVRLDTTHMRPDTAHVRPDTTHARPGTAHARSDSSAARFRPASAGPDSIPPPRPGAPVFAPLPWYDPVRANMILDQAGFQERGEDGIRLRAGLPFRIEVVYDRGNELRERIVTFLEEDFSRIGILLVPVPLDGPTSWRRFRTGAFQTALLGFRPPVVPDLTDLWASWGRWNGGGYASSRADSLILAQQAAATPAEVQHTARLLEEQVRRDRPAEFLIYREGVDLLSSRVRDFHGTCADPFSRLDEVWLADTTLVPDSAQTPPALSRP